MRFNIVLRYIGMILLVEALFMLLGAFISIKSGMDSGFTPLMLSFLLTSLLGVFPLIFVEKTQGVSSKETFGVVTGAWIVSCVTGMFPYLLWGGEFSFCNAWFESVSGFSTTGATILNDIEAVPRSLLFWRSSTHWLGGVGVVMFALVVLPVMGKSRMAMTNMEMSSMAKDNYRYPTGKTVRILLGVYIGLTVTEALLLKAAGMTWFDAVNQSFSNIATGGFSTKNTSIAWWHNWKIEAITGFFMLIAGIHFGLLFQAITGKPGQLWKSEVTRYYLICLAVSSVIVSVNILSNDVYDSFAQCFRHGAFQIISYATTTGFTTTDSNLWGGFPMLIALALSIQCGCAGSTSGGMKCDRMLVAMKVIGNRFRRQQHPEGIFRVKIDSKSQDDDVIQTVLSFVVLYLLIIFAGGLVNTACGLDFMSAMSASVSCIGNVGIGFGSVGSMENYASLPQLVKYSSTVLMLIGRLEIFGFIQLFLIKWWK